VRTTNITHFATDVGKVLFGGDPAAVPSARNRAVQTMQVIAGFADGCGLGATCGVILRLWSLSLPAGLALLAFVIGFFAARAGGSGV
jgi:uncharacterized membrane protein YoaK (UPF0700 family)